MCPSQMFVHQDMLWLMGIKIFLLVWIVFVPVAITNRLEKIIHLLEQDKH